MAVLAFVLVLRAAGARRVLPRDERGPKRARERQASQSRRGRRGATLLFVLTLLRARASRARRGDRDREGPQLDPRGGRGGSSPPLQEQGRELFGQRCRNCHTLEGGERDGARSARTLDELAAPKALVLDAIEKGRANGNGNMPAAGVEGEDAEAVARVRRASRAAAKPRSTHPPE